MDWRISTSTLKHYKVRDTHGERQKFKRRNLKKFQHLTFGHPRVKYRVFELKKFFKLNILEIEILSKWKFFSAFNLAITAKVQHTYYQYENIA